MNPLIETLEAELERLADSAPNSLSLDGVHQRLARRRHQRLFLRIVGSAGCAALLAAGLVASNHHAPRANSTDVGPAPSDDVTRGTESSAPSSEATTTMSLPDRGSDFVAATDPPLLSMPLDGWTISYIDDTTSGHVRLAVVDAVKGFAGGSFVVLPASNDPQLGTGTTIPTSPGASTSVDGLMIGTSDSFRWFEWHLDNSLISAHARHITEANALAITNAVELKPDGSLTINSVPAGMIALTDGEVTNMRRYLEYHWTSRDQSRTIGLTMQPGGDIGTQIAADDTSASPITFNGKPAYLTAGGMGVVRVEGFWVWAISGTGYSDSAQFLADAQHITATDQATWEAELAGHVILPSQRPEQVADILSDIPLPQGFNTQALTSSTQPKVRYQLIAEVTSAVWCAWAHDWDTALTAGDTTAAAAVQALTSSTTWHALKEIESQGAFAEAIWEYSARVSSGDRSVVSEAPGGLGCNN